jgi:L-lactate dehydrogenase (cytochrome)
MRALYLGADFVLVGRPFIWGVAALGQYGGDHVANILMDALQNNMVQLGATNFEQLRAADRAYG